GYRPTSPEYVTAVCRRRGVQSLPSLVLPILQAARAFGRRAVLPAPTAFGTEIKKRENSDHCGSRARQRQATPSIIGHSEKVKGNAQRRRRKRGQERADNDAALAPLIARPVADDRNT